VPVSNSWLEYVSATEAAGLYGPDTGAADVVADFDSHWIPDGSDRQRRLLAASRRMEQQRPVSVQYVFLY
jgi:hypothetical protein